MLSPCCVMNRKIRRAKTDQQITFSTYAVVSGSKLDKLLMLASPAAIFANAVAKLEMPVPLNNKQGLRPRRQSLLI